MSPTPARFALITGAAGGIGRALVDEFRGAGYSVIATDYVAMPADLRCEHYLRADLAQTVTDAEYRNDFFGTVKAIIGSNGLHALVNNAAVQVLGGTDSLTVDDWQQTINVNLLAPFVWTQALLSHLEEVHGCVVNISSIHASLTKPGFVAYATSKAALSGLTRSMAVDLGSRIRINAIEPAAIETEMLKAGFAGRPDLYSQLEKAHPSARIGLPKEVATLARIVADGSVGFLQGSCISLSGGIAARLHDPD
ncbi:MAG TPA: SDR family oxidoreductase [Aromatoleum sp.]|uniref:SDR family NAD(P)-dependent oxidoreductase n=1 Tax=Aromatoleum sp. TaxID=2307007 RepID=UPI002B45F0E6|nr:SDR family oxidoreductase [Aromatoleum sp.]HJV25560.1 SDR family oxidoreductase [Aromatoleum sp.]